MVRKTQYTKCRRCGLRHPNGNLTDCIREQRREIRTLLLDGRALEIQLRTSRAQIVDVKAQRDWLAETLCDSNGPEWWIERAKEVVAD